jgi:hypothetical protein
MRPCLALLAAALATACGARSDPLPVPPAAPAPPAGAGLHVWLAWSTPVDLDLYLTDPAWESLYFAHTPTRAGAELRRDVRCDTLPRSGAAFEDAVVASPSPGPYRIGVHFIDACGSGIERSAYRLVVDVDGAREETTGVVARERFEVVAFEFELTENAAGTMRLSVPSR